MVKNILNFIYKEIGGLHEAAYLLAIFTFGSQILALFRDRLLASNFGAGETLDIYYAAFKLPDFIFVSVASLVSFSVLIPFLAERIDDPQKNAKEFMNSIFSVFFIFIIGVSLLLFIFAPTLLELIFPSLSSGANFDTLLLLTRIMLLQPIFLGLSNLFASITQLYKKFVIYAISPLLYNIGIISGVLFFYPVFGVEGLAYGVALGALFHMLVQFPFIIRSGFLPKLNIRVKFNEIKKVITLSIPRTIALSTSQGVLIFLMAMASVINKGSISVFNLSFNLMNVPLAIVGVSYSVAAFPALSRLFVNGDRVKFFEKIEAATRHIIFWAVPVSVMFIALRAQIVRVILGSGKFDWADTRLTAAALGLFALSLVSNALVLLFARAYYASGKTKKPVFVNVLSSALSVASAYFFLFLFKEYEMFAYFMNSLLRVGGIEGTSVLMLPLGFSFGMIVNSIALWILFKKDHKDFSYNISRTFFQSFSGAVVAGFTAHYFLDVFDDVFNLQTFMGIFMQGFLAGVIGIFIGVSVLNMLKSKELKEVWQSLHSKFWKRPAVIASDQINT